MLGNCHISIKRKFENKKVPADLPIFFLVMIPERNYFFFWPKGDLNNMAGVKITTGPRPLSYKGGRAPRFPGRGVKISSRNLRKEKQRKYKMHLIFLNEGLQILMRPSRFQSFDDKPRRLLKFEPY